MPRTCVALAATIGLWSVAPGEPPPKNGDQPTTYFPTAIGTKWGYENLDGNNLVEEVVKAERKGAATTVTIRSVVEKGLPSEYQVRVDEHGVYRLDGRAFGRDLVMQYLKLLHKPGEKWTTRTGAWPIEVSDLTARPAETVVVPAGEFKAVRVDTKFPSKQGPDRAGSWWYASGVGLVRRTVGDHTQVLKSFTRGKE